MVATEFSALRSHRGLNWLAWSYVLLLVAVLATSHTKYQWDFFVYYDAALAFTQGVDPYPLENLSQYPNHPPVLPFVYPALTLHAFRPFLLLPPPVAYLVWLILKLLTLAALLWVWHRHFLNLAPDWMTVLYFVLAFNGTLFNDFATGNISVFEQLALWAGFASLCRGRVWPFCLAVVVVAQFKMTPLFFLLGLLLVHPRPLWKTFVASLAGFGALFSSNFWLHPELFRSFYAAASSMLIERGMSAPSTRALLLDGLEMFSRRGVPIPAGTDAVLFALIAAGVIAAGSWAVRSFRRQTDPGDPRLIVFLICLAYVLLLPRFKNYMFIYALVPTLYLLRVQTMRLLVPLVAVLVLLPHANSYVPIVGLAADLFFDYLPLLATFCVFGLFVLHLADPAAGKLHETKPPGTG